MMDDDEFVTARRFCGRPVGATVEESKGYMYSHLSPCGHPAIMDTRYYGQNPDPRRKL